MALTRNDKMLILAAVLLAAAVVAGLAWWRTSGRLPEPAAPQAQSASETQAGAKDAVQLPPPPPQATKEVQAPAGAPPQVAGHISAPAVPVGPDKGVSPPAPGAPPEAAPQGDKSLQAIFDEQPKPEPVPPAPAPELAPPAPAVEAPLAKPAPEKPKKPETRAERKARLAAERKAAEEARRAEGDARKAQAETLKRAQEELRQAEAELKRAEEKARKDAAAKAATPAAPAVPNPAPSPASNPAPITPEAKPSEKPKAGPERRVVDKVSVEETGDAVIYTLHGASTSAKPEATLLSGPPRLVIDLPGAWTFNRPEKSAGGPVKAVRVGSYPDKIRVVLDLAGQPKGAKHPVVEKTPEGLVIRLGK